MSGRRAPNMAAGEVMSTLMRFMSTSAGTLMAKLTAIALPQEVFAEIMRDFDAARQHIILYFRLKFSYWAQLPWILFALGHLVEATAKRFMQIALQLYIQRNAR